MSQSAWHVTRYLPVKPIAMWSTALVFRSDSPGKVAQWLAWSIRESWRGVVISYSFAFRATRRLKFSYKSILPCTAFPSTLVSMLELSPPLPVLLLLRVGGLSRVNTRAVAVGSVREATGQNDGSERRIWTTETPVHEEGKDWSECRTGHRVETRWGEILNLPNPSGRIRPWDLLSL
jgi:hypothetical protein